MEINKIYNLDCLQGLRNLDENSVNLTVTSCPYDNLRTYQGTCNWNFDIFKDIAKELSKTDYAYVLDIHPAAYGVYDGCIPW